MKTIYIDSEYHCHLTNDGTMTPVETWIFDDKCDVYIEGYCLEPMGEDCYKVYPWKDFEALDAAQRDYERDQLADAEQALAIMWGGVEE